MLPQQLPLAQMATTWAEALNPIIDNKLINGQLLQNQKLINGVTVINHRLGRKLVGYIIVGIDGAAIVYDSQATNQTPQLTLVLNSNAAVTAQIWCF